MLEGIAEEGGDFTPKLLEVPPPRPKKPLPKRETLGPPPEKPTRPSTVDLIPYLLPPLEENGAAITLPTHNLLYIPTNHAIHYHHKTKLHPLMINVLSIMFVSYCFPSAVEIPAPPEFSETDTGVEVPLSEDVGSDEPELQTQELPVSEWGNGEYDGTEIHPPDGETLLEALNPQFHDNGITVPEANGAPEYGVEFQEIQEPDPATDVLDSSSPVSQDIQPIAG